MIYKLFSSIKTSIFIILSLCILLIVGTVFPQAPHIPAVNLQVDYLDIYIKDGGKFASLVEAFDLFNVFTSPLFIIFNLLLLISITVCSYDRFMKFRKRKTLSRRQFKEGQDVLLLREEGVEEKLRENGFKLRGKDQSPDAPGIKIYVKGFPVWWYSWVFHVGLILCIIGFSSSALFGFEKWMLLDINKPAKFALYNKETWWNRIMKNAGFDVPENSKTAVYSFTLRKAIIENYQLPRIDYPKNVYKRLLIAMGREKIEPSKEIYKFSPKDWVTRVDIENPDGSVTDVEFHPNKPFRLGWMTLYQMAPAYRIKFIIDDSEEIKVNNYEKFTVKNVKGKFQTSLIKVGTLFKKDGTTEKIIPTVSFHYIHEKIPQEKEKIVDIQIGEKINVEGVLFEFADYDVSFNFFCRYDPGLWFVGIACLLSVAALFVRIFSSWHRVQLAVDKNGTYVRITSSGVGADKEQILRKLLR